MGTTCSRNEQKSAPHPRLCVDRVHAGVQRLEEGLLGARGLLHHPVAGADGDAPWRVLDRDAVLGGGGRQRDVTHLYVCGLALDVCVAFTALHAAEEGFVVTVVEDACAGVSVEGIDEKKALFASAGVTVTSSSELPGLFATSTVSELSSAALRVRNARQSVRMLELEPGHGRPNERKAETEAADHPEGKAATARSGLLVSPLVALATQPSSG